MSIRFMILSNIVPTYLLKKGCVNMKQHIGFIGLGIMGKPMAINLIKAGYRLHCYDIVSTAIDEIAHYGAIGCKSIKDVAEHADLIITMLPNTPHVKDVVLGKDGLADSCQPGTLIIDMSSIAPIASREIGQALAFRGIRLLEAPVSGGEPKAIDGTLAIMAGGEQVDFDRAKPLFDVLGSSYILIGPLGSGNICKLTNQIIVAANIAALAEGMMLAKQAGADPYKVFHAIRGGLAGSTVMDAKAQMMLDENFEPGFRVSLHIKDLANALETGNSCSAPLPLAAAVQQMFLSLRAHGYDALDHSALWKYYVDIASAISQS